MFLENSCHIRRVKRIPWKILNMSLADCDKFSVCKSIVTSKMKTYFSLESDINKSLF